MAINNNYVPDDTSQWPTWGIVGNYTRITQVPQCYSGIIPVILFIYLFFSVSILLFSFMTIETVAAHGPFKLNINVGYFGLH